MKKFIETKKISLSKGIYKNFTILSMISVFLQRSKRVETDRVDQQLKISDIKHNYKEIQAESTIR